CAHFSTRKYTAMVPQEQHQRHEADFDTEFGEYRHLYARMQSVTKKFKQLGAQQKLLSPGSREYQVKRDETAKIVLQTQCP
ncbi:ELL2 factor, partial [Rhynochetos jubatus]|nr:ELL2 factor [Rhynochetos jubatus]